MPHFASTATHSLDSDFVRDQLLHRSVDINGKRHNPEGEYVLYWMHSTQRLEENWAFRAAVRAADKLGRPLLVYQELDSTYPFASDRHHTFALQGVHDTWCVAQTLGVHFLFALRNGPEGDGSILTLAGRAYLVVTDLYPTGGIAQRVAALGVGVNCRVIAVDSYCTVPSGLLARAEFAARTIRPKLAKVLPHALEPVEERGPRVVWSDALRQSVHSMLPKSLVNLFVDDEHTRTARIKIAVAQCSIDHSVDAVATVGGARSAHARLQHFVEHALDRYDDDRNEASNEDATSRLSPYLRFGQIAPAAVVRSALQSNAKRVSVDAFIDQVTTWRELAFNWCLRSQDHASLDALPAWVQRTMAEHAEDARPALYSLDVLERASTGDALWNAAQAELLRTGTVHNYARMLWGKMMLLWTPTYDEARTVLFHLNDKWALDGSDPCSVGGIMWCFGLWDRPWGNKPVWGGIRPMLTSRASRKFDVDRYIQRHVGHQGRLFDELPGQSLAMH